MPPTQVMTDMSLMSLQSASEAEDSLFCDVARSRKRFGAGSVGIAVIVASFSCAASHVGGGELD